MAIPTCRMSLSAAFPATIPGLELDARVEANTERPLGTFEAGEYHLYESTPSGYRNVSSITLA